MTSNIFFQTYLRDFIDYNKIHKNYCLYNTNISHKIDV